VHSVGLLYPIDTFFILKQSCCVATDVYGIAVKYVKKDGSVGIIEYRITIVFFYN
jgi:hypothetical protein